MGFTTFFFIFLQFVYIFGGSFFLFCCCWLGFYFFPLLFIFDVFSAFGACFAFLVVFYCFLLFNFIVLGCVFLFFFSFLGGGGGGGIGSLWVVVCLFFEPQLHSDLFLFSYLPCFLLFFIFSLVVGAGGGGGGYQTHSSYIYIYIYTWNEAWCWEHS